MAQHQHTIAQRLQGLADNLERRMHEQGMSELGLAKASGVSKRTIGNFLRPANRKDRPGKDDPSSGTLTSLCKIAEALGVEAWEVLRVTSSAQDHFHATIAEAIEAAYQERHEAEAPPTRYLRAR